MTYESKKEYLNAIMVRYNHATKKGKTKILDEFCAVCGYSRKHAIRILKGASSAKKKRPGPCRKYGDEVIKHLIVLWKRMNKMCSIRLKAALPVWLKYYNEGNISQETKGLLCEMSSSTIDRLLRPYKKKKGLTSTRASAFLKTQIPIELLDGAVKKPGSIEADTVAHCGNSLSGEFANSLTLTDLFSGWTVNRATWTKHSLLIVEKIAELRTELPFRIINFAADNGGEFVNYNLSRYFQDAKKGKVKFVRRRPYKKNDAAHVEQKNDTHVRQLFGYSRLDHPEFIHQMNKIYKEFWNPLLNFFCPVMKLKRKERIGAKIRKWYDTPKSPYQRLLDCGHLTTKQQELLEKRFESLNPFEIEKGLKRELEKFRNMLNEYRGLVNDKIPA